MKRFPLTTNQKRILEFLVKTKAKKGNSPSIIEIREHFGFKAIGTVQDYLASLQKKGFIRRSSKARDIEILDNAGIEPSEKETVRLPIVGRVPAGSPIWAEQNLEGFMYVDRTLARTRDMFLLRVKGNSMIDAHIVDGDLVLIRPQKSCENGEVVVCLVEDEATVKRIYKRKNYIELKPENETIASMMIRPGQRFSLIGKVIGIIRPSI